MHLRNYKGTKTELLTDPTMMKGWQDVFGTTSRQVVEEELRKSGAEFQWRDGDSLRIVDRGSAIAKHPVTGEKIWFNHSQVLHWSMIPSEYYRIYKRLGQMNTAVSSRHTTASPSHQAHHSLTQPSGTPQPHPAIRHTTASPSHQAHHSLTQPSGTPQPHPAIRHITASPSHQAHHSLIQPSGTPQPHPAIRHTTASPSHQAHQTLQGERVRAHLVKMKDIDMDIDEASDTGIPSSLWQLEKEKGETTRANGGCFPLDNSCCYVHTIEVAVIGWTSCLLFQERSRSLDTAKLHRAIPVFRRHDKWTVQEA
ncbi:hypothetical protein EMCRGX_G010839 [Ephydatia muelleri]